MKVDDYLSRIGYEGSRAPSADLLRELHRAHMLHVPFENLDIALRVPITIDEDRFYDKVVVRHRGGFCYELNGLFAALLRALGFRVTLLSARVVGGNGPSQEFDHLALLVRIPVSDSPWLADVGFGDCFVEPLRFVVDVEQQQGSAMYRLTEAGGRRLVERMENGAWKPLYDFSLNAHELAEFAGMCRYHQTSPESPFMQRRVCSRATANGRITLADMRLIRTNGDRREQRTLASEEEFRAALWEHFGIVL